MKTRNFFVLILFGSFLFSNCKKEIEVTTSTATIGTYWSNGKKHTVTEVIQTPDDQYLICGNVVYGEHGNLDGFLMKVDQNLNTLWYKNFGAKFDDYFGSMATDENGNILLCGITNSFEDAVDSTSFRKTDLFYLVFTDKNGNLKWEKTHQPKGNNSTENYNSTVSKVIYLNNGKFCIGGSTTNIKNISPQKDFSYHAYAFIVDNAGGLLKSSLFHDGVNSSTIDDAILDADGNVILLFSDFVNFLPDRSAIFFYNRLIKMKNENAPFSINQWMSKSDSTLRTWNFAQAFVPSQIENGNGNNKVILANGSDNLSVVDATKTIEKSMVLQKKVEITNITKKGNLLIINGNYYKDFRNLLCWATISQEGNIIKEVYTDIEFYKKENKQDFRSLFLSNKNEMIAIGSETNATTSNIRMIKFDENGNLKK